MRNECFIGEVQITCDMAKAAHSYVCGFPHFSSHVGIYFFQDLV